MKIHSNLAETAIAIMGLWFIASPLPDFFAGVFTYAVVESATMSDPLWISSLVFTSIKVVFGIGLIGFSSQIALVLRLNPDTSLEIKHALSAAILLLGLYFVLEGAVSLGQHIALDTQPDVSNPYLYWQGIFSIGIGSLLSITSVLISRIWWRYQHADA